MKARGNAKGRKKQSFLNITNIGKLPHHGNPGATMTVTSVVRSASAYHDYEKWFINSETIPLGGGKGGKKEEKNSKPKPTKQTKRNPHRMFNENVIEEALSLLAQFPDSLTVQL